MGRWGESGTFAWHWKCHISKGFLKVLAFFLRSGGPWPYKHLMSETNGSLVFRLRRHWCTSIIFFYSQKDVVQCCASSVDNRFQWKWTNVLLYTLRSISICQQKTYTFLQCRQLHIDKAYLGLMFHVQSFAVGLFTRNLIRDRGSKNFMLWTMNLNMVQDHKFTFMFTKNKFRTEKILTSHHNLYKCLLDESSTKKTPNSKYILMFIWYFSFHYICNKCFILFVIHNALR